MGTPAGVEGRRSEKKSDSTLGMRSKTRKNTHRSKCATGLLPTAIACVQACVQA